MEKPYSLDDYVDELIDFLTQNGIEKPCVVAHSFGARVAIKALARESNLFSKLVLVGAAGLKPKRTIKKTLKKLAFNFLKLFLPRSRLKAFYSQDYLALDATMQESFKLIVNEHLDSYLDCINIPTLIVFGDKDKQTPLYMAKRFFKHIKGSKLLVFKGAGHFCFIDCPNKFNMEVREFLLS